MSKKPDKKYIIKQMYLPKGVEPQERNARHFATATKWPNFDTFWATCIKNGSQIVKDACIAHLKAIGAWENPEDWVSGVRHFGIDFEENS